MRRRIGSATFSVVVLAAISTTAPAQSNLTAKAGRVRPVPASAVVESDRIRDGLVGPVRRLRTEVVKLSNESGKLQEGKRAVLEIVAYDIKGNKIENQYFPISGANLTGKEVYKYDDKGNISEMTLLNTDGSLAGKEVYKYEFDFAGNWNKMTTAVAVIEAGKMSFEPTEVTYRSIMYYLDENMMKMAQPSLQPSIPPGSPSSAPANNLTASNPETKSGPVPKSTVNNSTSTPKISLALPGAVNVDKVSSLRSVEVATAETSPNSEVPVVQLESDPPPAPKPILRPVSGGVLNGTALSLPSPTYPEAARRMRTAGVVSVEVVVDETGKVISAVASSGPTALREVAVQAALRARFSPTKLSGQPVKVSGLINYKFAIAQ
jgi:protein TonB